MYCHNWCIAEVLHRHYDHDFYLLFYRNHKSRVFPVHESAPWQVVLSIKNNYFHSNSDLLGFIFFLSFPNQILIPWTLIKKIDNISLTLQYTSFHLLLNKPGWPDPGVDDNQDRTYIPLGHRAEGSPENRISPDPVTIKRSAM